MASYNPAAQDLAIQIKRYAHEHYSSESLPWDILVECYTLDEIEDLIGGRQTFQSALQKIRSVLRHSRYPWQNSDGSFSQEENF